MVDIWKLLETLLALMWKKTASSREEYDMEKTLFQPSDQSRC